MKILLQQKFYGAVVGAWDICVDFGIGQLLCEAFGDNKVVDAPAGVLFSGPEPVGPPGVDAFQIRVEMAEGVYKARFQHMGHFGTLLVGEACIFPVGLGILQINLFVGHIQISTVDDGFFLIKALYIVEKIILPFHAVIQSGKAVLGVGGVDGYQIEVRKFQGNHPSFMVVLFYADSAGHGQGFLFGKYGCSAVPFFLSIIPVLLITRQIQVNLSLLQFGFLQTEDIGIQFLKIF